MDSGFGVKYWRILSSSRVDLEKAGLHLITDFNLWEVEGAQAAAMFGFKLKQPVSLALFDVVSFGHCWCS